MRKQYVVAYFSNFTLINRNSYLTNSALNVMTVEGKAFCRNKIDSRRS